MTEQKRVLHSVSMKLAISAAFAMAAILWAPSPAMAQGVWDRDRNVSVTQRPRPGYDALGIRSGAFLWKPKAEISLEFNDNIFATASSRESDTILVAKPSVSVTTTWSNHAFNAQAEIERRNYFDHGDESTTNYSFGAGGRLDVERGTSLSAGASYGRFTEPRTSAGAAGLASEPLRFDTTSFFVGGGHVLNRLRLSGRFDTTRFDYDDAALFGGGVASQDFRDRDHRVITARADYAVSPDTAVFVRYRHNDRDYRLSPPAVAAARDSSGYTIDAGVEFDVGGMARGEIGVGYTEQDYDDPIFVDVSSFSVDARVEWFPTQLTTITVSAQRSVEDSGIAGAAGYLGTNVSAQVDHELLRNVILTARADYARDDYQGLDREDRRLGVAVQATYLMNRAVGLQATFSHVDQDSTGAASSRDFRVNRLMVGVVLQR